MNYRIKNKLKSMSSYAFFKEWLALSLSFDYIIFNPFILKFSLRTLPNGLGCFPFDIES